MEKEPQPPGGEPTVEDNVTNYANGLSAIEKDLSERPERVTEALSRMISYIYEPIYGLGSHTEEIVARQNQ